MNVIECKNCKALNYQTSDKCHNCKVELYEEITSTYFVTNPVTSKEAILNQMEELKKQLKELDKIEKTNDFIKLLRDVLLNDKCTIILQGHEEWQFQEKYLMKDIKFEHRKAIAKSLQEIIKEINNDK